VLALLTSATAARDHSYAADLNRVFLLQRFAADEVRGQCGFAQDNFRTPFGVWSVPAYVNTDSRPGGCLQSFAIVDPDRDLAGLSLTIDFEAYGPKKACDHLGPRDVPVGVSDSSATWTRPYRIDTDERDGGCTLGFSVRGRPDITLDVEVRADGVLEQCPDRGDFTASVGHPITIRIRTDDRMGGCYLRFRLSKRDSAKLP
jgi:hypothetical protein